MDNHWRQKALFVIGDYAAGGAVGAATAMAVRVAVRPGFDVVLAMLAGMATGMFIHLMAALFLSPVLGFFHTMVPGSLIGMYGGMLFAMRDSMEQQPSSPAQVILVGIIFGLVITAGVRLYDRALHPAVESGNFGKGIGDE